MSWLKTVWGTLFRLFPAPTAVGLRRIGRPGRDSPVLLTCNFHLTVERLTRTLRGHDAWLLVADSKGVNVWCAAGAQELDTSSVVSVVKTSGIGELVDHRALILPPMAAPGVRKRDVEAQTGWEVRWGPLYLQDIPDYLASGGRREHMKRAVYGWRERLDTGLGSLFPFYLLGAVGVAIFGPGLLPNYLVVAGVVFLAFMLAAPWLPGQRGITKALLVDLALAAALVAAELLGVRWLRADLIIAMVMTLIYGTELGGLASTMRSDMDPLLAKLGIGRLGNTHFAGTMRTDLLNGKRLLTLEATRCKACGSCAEVCPLHVWELDTEGRAVLARLDDCTACTACVMQCESGAIKAGKVAA